MGGGYKTALLAVILVQFTAGLQDHHHLTHKYAEVQSKNSSLNKNLENLKSFKKKTNSLKSPERGELK